MGKRARRWLTVLLAGLFGLAIVSAPAEHARAVLRQAGTAAMQAESSHDMHGHGKPTGPHDRHQSGPACMACVLVAAPGLPVPAPVAAALTAIAAATAALPEAAAAARKVPWTPQSARAPPAGSIA